MGIEQQPSDGAPEMHPVHLSPDMERAADEFFRLNPDADKNTPAEEETSH